jgi:hypothetical protein
LIGKADDLICCPSCGARVRGKKLAEHMKKHASKQKIAWNRFPHIRRQKEEQRRLKKLAGKPQTRFVSGGTPGLGKQK